MASTDVMHDPNWLIANMRGRGPHDPIRAQMEAQLHQLEVDNQQRVQQEQFAETRRQRQDIHNDRSDQRDLAQGQLDNYRQGLAADKESKGEDRRTAMLTHLLDHPDTDPAIKTAIQNHLLKQSGVSATLPVDPKVAALARSKGLPEPQGKVLGTGQAQGGASADNRPVSPFGTTLNVDAGKVYGQPHPQGTDINTNTGEFVPSDLVGTINGKPSTQAVAEGALKRGVSPEDTRSRGVYNALRSDPSLGANQPAPNENMVANPVSESNTASLPTSKVGFNVEDLTTKPTPNPTNTGFERANQKLGNIGQSLEPFTAVKNVVGSLFGGGQGGANEIVKQPPPQATPAPGTEFQGPLTATAGFLGQPNAPTPVPANTPPAIPPTNKPTPEEERRRMALQQ